LYFDQLSILFFTTEDTPGYCLNIIPLFPAVLFSAFFYYGFFELNPAQADTCGIFFVSLTIFLIL